MLAILGFGKRPCSATLQPADKWRHWKSLVPFPNEINVLTGKLLSYGFNKRADGSVKNGYFFRCNARCARVVDGFNDPGGMADVSAVRLNEKYLTLVLAFGMRDVATRFRWSERRLTCINDTSATAVVELETDGLKIGAGREFVEVLRICAREIVMVWSASPTAKTFTPAESTRFVTML